MREPERMRKPWRSVWLAVGLIAAAGAAPAIGQRPDAAARSKPSSTAQRPAAGKLKKPGQAPSTPRRPGQAAVQAKQPRKASGKLKQVKPAAAPRRDLKGEEQRLQETRERLRSEREKAAQARRREGSATTELEEVSRRLATKQREVAELDSRVRRAQGELTALQRDIARLEGRRALQEALLARRLVALYKVQALGGTVPALLSGEDPDARAAAVRHLASLAALDTRIIEEHRETSRTLADRKSQGQERERELTGLRVSARREQAEVDREAARRRVLLAKVRDERAYHERMVGDLTESSRRLEAFIAELQAKQRQAAAQAAAKAAAQAAAQAARITPPRAPTSAPTPPAASGAPPATAIAAVPARGRLSWPTAGTVTAGFGAQVHPRFGTRTFRNGVDIEAAEGTGVDAVLAGQVVYTGWFKGYGNLIIIDHGDELFTLYAHVSQIHVKEGDTVRQGQRIGAVGDTGSLSGPRLYFEVRYRGKPQDPEQWLRQRG
jgi:septal ring factor EnvC (AmiA/AmiB activator)